MEKGNLSIVATPIGNLQDITLRAIETIRNSDFIACEDTRVSSHLLAQYGIKSELISLNARTETSKSDYIIGRILKGENCSYMSDAGTPGISDPGTRLVAKAYAEDIRVVAIPGPCAFVAALSICGIATNSFIFEGFLPQKKGRQKKLKELSLEERTVVLYESTYRIEKLINELNQYMPQRFIEVMREITKKFEEVWKGLPGEILKSLPEKTIKGEFVVILAPKDWK